MKYSLSNKNISILVDSESAELISLKKGDREYMWNRNPEYWDRCSPILFPLTGGLKGGSYILDGKTYSMPKHGFAIKSDFTLIKTCKDKLVFSLKSSEESLKIWPCSFELLVTYTLQDSFVNVELKVINTGEETMYFSIGAHPGFSCPCEGHSYVAYTKEGPASYEEITLLSPDGLLSHQKEGISFKNGFLPISKSLFEKGKGTLVFLDTSICKVSLADENAKEYLSVDFDTPVLALWSCEKEGAAFACIEPWCGVCDYQDADGNWKQRLFSNTLKKGECFTNSYSINILQQTKAAMDFP